MLPTDKEGNEISKSANPVFSSLGLQIPDGAINGTFFNPSSPGFEKSCVFWAASALNQARNRYGGAIDSIFAKHYNPIQKTIPQKNEKGEVIGKSSWNFAKGINTGGEAELYTDRDTFSKNNYAIGGDILFMDNAFSKSTFTIGGQQPFNTATVGNAVRLEVLDPNLYTLTPDAGDFPFWMMLPKKHFPTTFVEVNQQISLSSDDSALYLGSTYEEGQAANLSDNPRLVRRFIELKTFSTRADSTIHGILTNTQKPVTQLINAAAKVRVLKSMVQQLFYGDSDVRPNDVDGFFTQIYPLDADDVSTTRTNYYNRGIYDNYRDYRDGNNYLNLRGTTLTKPMFDTEVAKLSVNYGKSANLVLHPMAMSLVNTAMNNDTQRWIVPNTTGEFGARFSTLFSPSGPQVGTKVISDKWTIPRNYMRRAGDIPAGSRLRTASRRPLTPTSIDVEEITAANISGSTNDNPNYTAPSEYLDGQVGTGSRLYAVSAINNVGESPLVINTTAVTVGEGMGISIKITNPALNTQQGAVAATGYRIFSTDPRTDPSPTGDSVFYEIAYISESEYAAGVFAGAGLGTDRANQYVDLGRRLPNTCSAVLYDTEAIQYDYLIPISMMHVAITNLIIPTIGFSVGAPQVNVPSKVNRLNNLRLSDVGFDNEAYS